MTGARRLRERAVRVRGARIPGSGGWQPYLLTITALVLIWMALWGSVSIVVIIIGIAVSAAVVLLFPLPTMHFRFGLHPWRMIQLLARFLWDVVVASVQVGALAVRLRRRPFFAAVARVVEVLAGGPIRGGLQAHVAFALLGEQPPAPTRFRPVSARADRGLRPAAPALAIPAAPTSSAAPARKPA